MTAPRVGIFSFGRTQSQRCPNKMLRPFGETTLTDLVLAKLARCEGTTFFAGREEAFRQKCARHGVRYVERDARSATIDGPILEILAFLKDMDCSHFLLVSGCLPFLRLETIQGFLRDCVAHESQPAFGVVRRQNYFMGLDRRPLNFDPGAATINTKTVEPVYEFAHALYFFERDYFFRHGTYWDWRTVRLVELPAGQELLDIDTEADFRMAEALWREQPVLKTVTGSSAGLTPAARK